jgi:hypothetical protein
MRKDLVPECLLHQVKAVSSALRKLDSERGGVERINSPSGYVSSNEAEARRRYGIEEAMHRRLFDQRRDRDRSREK